MARFGPLLTPSGVLFPPPLDRPWPSIASVHSGLKWHDDFLSTPSSFARRPRSLPLAPPRFHPAFLGVLAELCPLSFSTPSIPRASRLLFPPPPRYFQGLSSDEMSAPLFVSQPIGFRRFGFCAFSFFFLLLAGPLTSSIACVSARRCDSTFSSAPLYQHKLPFPIASQHFSFPPQMVCW